MKTAILSTLLFLGFSYLSDALPADSLRISDRKVTFGYKPASGRAIDAVILHSTFNNSGGEPYDIDRIIAQFARYNVSAHYLVGRDGTVYRLVEEKDVSWHAGKSKLPDGRTAVNASSLGIELVTSYSEAPTADQIKALVLLLKDIKKRHRIRYVLRHSDIAPGRKTDPWNMDWEGFLSALEKK